MHRASIATAGPPEKGSVPMIRHLPAISSSYILNELSALRRSRAGGTASPAHRSRSTSVGSQSSNGHGVRDGWRQSFWVNPKLNWWKTSSILNKWIYHESPYRSSWCVLLMDQQWVPLCYVWVHCSIPISNWVNPFPLAKVREVEAMFIWNSSLPRIQSGIRKSNNFWPSDGRAEIYFM